ncbi:ATPase AAA [Aeromonas phage phiA019]|nr:ATPase AAA [Aeromonas phage phiA009]ULG01680.1 ATPase AAA [Aeromonas phage phiA019]
MKSLILVRGVSGSGKSTFVKNIVHHQYFVETDMYFIDDNGNYNFDASKLKQAHDWCRFQVEETMKDDDDVIVSNTFTTEWEMKPYLDLAEKYGYTVFTVIIENRHGNKDIHNVPIETRQKQAERLSKSIKLI